MSDFAQNVNRLDGIESAELIRNEHEYGIVYILTNKINGKKYVGRTSSTIRRRMADHISKSSRGFSSPLHSAIRKYGIENFSYETIKCLFKDLNKTEKEMIERLDSANNGYNKIKKARNVYQKYENGSRTIGFTIDNKKADMLEKYAEMNRKYLTDVINEAISLYFDSIGFDL